jgi:hypothetical protein
MFQILKLQETIEQAEFVENKNTRAFRPKHPIAFQVGSVQENEFLTVTFDLTSEYDAGDIKTLNVNAPAGLLKLLDNADKCLQAKLNKDSGIRWKPLVVQEGGFEARVAVKLNCKDNSPQSTKFYTWDGVARKDGKPVTEPASVADLHAGQHLVMTLAVGNVWRFKGARGVSLYAKHVLIVNVQAPEEPAWE